MTLTTQQLGIDTGISMPERRSPCNLRLLGQSDVVVDEGSHSARDKLSAVHVDASTAPNILF